MKLALWSLCPKMWKKDYTTLRVIAIKKKTIMLFLIQLVAIIMLQAM
jgi:hypothetical protein